MALPPLICDSCASIFDVREAAWRCPCGGLFNVSPDWRPSVTFGDGGQGMWRYQSALPVRCDEAVSMGEGGTPIIRSRTLPGLGMKVEFLSPTLSFKDRGAVLLATLASRIGVRAAMVDSSGNAGTAVAAYFGRAGIKCEVLVPGGTSPAKLAQIEAHGAAVTVIPGTRADAAAAAVVIAERGDVFYASHVYHPDFLHGVKTYGYEIWEQGGRSLPAAVLVPVGNGTMLLGCYLAFRELIAAGLAARMPALIAVQAGGCAPLVNQFWGLGSEVAGATVAEGIAIAAPPRGEQILAAVRASGGTLVAVGDEDIISARRTLAREGLFVESTAAVCFAAAMAAPRQTGPGWDIVRTHLAGGDVIAALCGAGRKDSAS